jgi:hypothetical protein
MVGKIEQSVCIRFCVKLLGKSATEILAMLREAFGEHSLRRTAVFEWHSRFKAGLVSVEDDKVARRPSTNETIEYVEKVRELIQQSMSSQTPLGSVMEFARRSY